MKSLLGKTADTKTGLSSTAASGAASAADAADSDAGTPPALLRNVVSALTELDKDEQQGIVPSKELLKKAQDAVDALSGFLAGQQPQTTPLAAANTTPDQSTTAGATAAPAVAGAAAAAATAGSPVDDGDDATAATNAELSQLSNKLQSLASAVGKDQAGLGTDLTQLAKLLDPKTLAPATAAQLGFASDGTPAATGLTAAINGFVHGKAPTGLGQPALAAPVLKLASKATAASAPAGDAGKSAASAPADAAGPATKPATQKALDADAKDSKPDANPTPVDAAPIEASAPTATAVPSAAAANGAASVIVPTTALPAASATADLRQAQIAYQLADPMAANLPQMAFEIARRAQQGSDQFEISMDPKDLGRVDVKLAIDSTTGAVTAHLTADRPETLDLLKRDAGALGQALTQAGLDAGKTNLQFSLNQNPSPRQDARQDSGGSTPGLTNEDGSAASLNSIAPVAMAYQGMATSSGLNIFV